MHERCFDAAGANRLDDPERQTWSPPSELVERLALKPGCDIADVGAGTGYFTLPLARAVAPSGRVYAVDVQPAMLDRLRAKLQGVPDESRIPLVEGEATRTTLADRVADLVLLANVWHELDDQPAALREAARLLRPEGRLAILDWRPGVGRPPGPPEEHRVAVEQIRATLVESGWGVTEAGPIWPYHSLVIATRPMNEQGD